MTADCNDWYSFLYFCFWCRNWRTYFLYADNITFTETLIKLLTLEVMTFNDIYVLHRRWIWQQNLYAKKLNSHYFWAEQYLLLLSRLAPNQSSPFNLIHFLQTSLGEFSIRAHLSRMALHRGQRDLALIFQVVPIQSVQFSSAVLVIRVNLLHP